MPATGLGARYRMLFRVGAAEVGGLVEVVEFDEPCDFAWTSVTGLDHRGRWRLREAPGGRTRVELRLAYVVAGAGPERLAGRADRRAHRGRARPPDARSSSSASSSTSSSARPRRRRASARG